MLRFDLSTVKLFPSDKINASAVTAFKAHCMSNPPQRARDTYHVGNLAPQLLSAARDMLEEVGPTKLSLRAVSERVGVSSTAAYHHYANRAELIGHLAAQGFRELAKALRIDNEHDNSRQNCVLPAWPISVSPVITQRFTSSCSAQNSPIATATYR